MKALLVPPPLNPLPPRGGERGWVRQEPIETTGFRLEFIPMKIGAEMTKTEPLGPAVIMPAGRHTIGAPVLPRL
jgi:hypothetical protein